MNSHIPNKPARLKLLEQAAVPVRPDPSAFLRTKGLVEGPACGEPAEPFQPYGPPLAVGAPVQRKTPKSEFLKWLEQKSNGRESC